MKINYFDENSLQGWRFIIVMQIKNCDENSSLRLKFVPEMKIYHSYEKIALDED